MHAVTNRSVRRSCRPRSWTRWRRRTGPQCPGRPASCRPPRGPPQLGTEEVQRRGARVEIAFGGPAGLLSCRSLPRSFGLCQWRSGIAGSNLMPSLRRRPACPGARPCPGGSSLDTACAPGFTWQLSRSEDRHYQLTKVSTLRGDPALHSHRPTSEGTFCVAAPLDRVIHAVDRGEGGSADSARNGGFAPSLSLIQLGVKRKNALPTAKDPDQDGRVPAFSARRMRRLRRQEPPRGIRSR